jgi:hypothetical protein
MLGSCFSGRGLIAAVELSQVVLRQATLRQRVEYVLMSEDKHQKRVMMFNGSLCAFTMDVAMRRDAHNYLIEGCSIRWEDLRVLSVHSILLLYLKRASRIRAS